MRYHLGHRDAAPLLHEIYSKRQKRELYDYGDVLQRLEAGEQPHFTPLPLRLTAPERVAHAIRGSEWSDNPLAHTKDSVYCLHGVTPQSSTFREKGTEISLPFLQRFLGGGLTPNMEHCGSIVYNTTYNTAQHRKAFQLSGFITRPEIITRCFSRDVGSEKHIAIINGRLITLDTEYKDSPNYMTLPEEIANIDPPMNQFEYFGAQRDEFINMCKSHTKDIMDMRRFNIQHALLNLVPELSEQEQKNFIYDMFSELGEFHPTVTGFLEAVISYYRDTENYQHAQPEF